MQEKRDFLEEATRGRETRRVDEGVGENLSKKTGHTSEKQSLDTKRIFDKFQIIHMIGA